MFQLFHKKYYILIQKPNNLFLLTFKKNDKNEKNEISGYIRHLPEIYTAGKIEPRRHIPTYKSKEFISIEDQYLYLKVLRFLHDYLKKNSKATTIPASNLKVYLESIGYNDSLSSNSYVSSLFEGLYIL